MAGNSYGNVLSHHQGMLWILLRQGQFCSIYSKYVALQKKPYFHVANTVEKVARNLLVKHSNFGLNERRIIVKLII